MKRYEFTDNHENYVRVMESGSKDNLVWLLLDGKRYENNEVKMNSFSSCMTAGQARILIACLQDLVEAMEKKS